MLATALLPGFLAAQGELHAASGVEGATQVACGPVALCHWGLADIAAGLGGGPVVVASRVARRTVGAVASDEVVAEMRADPRALADMLPPFAAIAGDSDGVQVVADAMGFQHVFHTQEASRTAVISTSALLAARATGATLDTRSVGVQSLLGWQLGQRTLFEGITKLKPGAGAAIGAAGLVLSAPTTTRPRPIERRDAVTQAAQLLRVSLSAVLDDFPDAVLQLTGGMDSRLLLSAIPESRRRGLHAMTLEVPGKGDVALARMLSERYGMLHEVRGLTGIGNVSPADAWELCRVEATRLDAMADPVALAAQRIAERAFEQGVRISGLGGEVARGFYYVGRVTERGYTKQDAARLASWRMFVNDAVEPGLLTEEFSGWAREVTVDEVYEALRAGGQEWFRATDELYLRHRMQRWAGATDIAVSAQRIVINPMLDPEFIDLVARLRPQDKMHSRFLAELQMELDPELGRVPLDGRPTPAAYADPSPWRPVTQTLSTAKRLAGKALQRAQRGNRPPAGGEILAAKVVEHWRSSPEVIAPLSTLPFVSESWLAKLVGGEIEPRPSSVAFATNLLVATGADD